MALALVILISVAALAARMRRMDSSAVTPRNSVMGIAVAMALLMPASVAAPQNFAGAITVAAIAVELMGGSVIAMPSFVAAPASRLALPMDGSAAATPSFAAATPVTTALPMHAYVMPAWASMEMMAMQKPILGKCACQGVE